MEWLKNLNGKDAFKLFGIGLLALLGITLIASLFGTGFGRVGMMAESGVMSPRVSSAPSFDSYAKEEMAYGGADLSIRNVVGTTMPVPQPGYTPGTDAEAFEVKQYTASIETRNLAADCEVVRSLKAKSEVIFENANEYERGCSYTFKVEKNEVETVLALIEGLNPKDVSESVYTIKQEVTDYTSEVEILEKKLASLDATLAEALASYENITALATRTGDVESLARIIDSKLTLIERLTNARLETSGQLERIARAKAEALDRLAYTYFSVSIYENKFIDGEAIADSWKGAVQRFVVEVNTLLQEISIGFISLLLLLIKFALYGVLLLFVLRFAWQFTKQVWNKPSN